MDQGERWQMYDDSSEGCEQSSQEQDSYSQTYDDQGLSSPSAAQGDSQAFPGPADGQHHWGQHGGYPASLPDQRWDEGNGALFGCGYAVDGDPRLSGQVIQGMESDHLLSQYLGTGLPDQQQLPPPGLDRSIFESYADIGSDISLSTQDQIEHHHTATQSFAQCQYMEGHSSPSEPWSSMNRREHTQYNTTYGFDGPGVDLPIRAASDNPSSGLTGLGYSTSSSSPNPMVESMVTVKPPNMQCPTDTGELEHGRPQNSWTNPTSVQSDGSPVGSVQSGDPNGVSAAMAGAPSGVSNIGPMSPYLFLPCAERASLSPSSPRLSPSSGTSSAPTDLMCPECGSKFTGEYRKGNFERHRKHRHGGHRGTPRILECEDEECRKVFRRQDARLKHYRRHHPERASPANPVQGRT